MICSSASIWDAHVKLTLAESKSNFRCLGIIYFSRLYTIVNRSSRDLNTVVFIMTLTFIRIQLPRVTIKNTKTVMDHPVLCDRDDTREKQ